MGIPCQDYIGVRIEEVQLDRDRAREQHFCVSVAASELRAAFCTLAVYIVVVKNVRCQ